MGRTKSKKRPSSPSFVPMTWDMLNSKAYKDLPHSAGKALPLFLGKIKRTYNDPERDTSTFVFPYDEAKRHGFAAATFNSIIKYLMRYGFIEPVSKGGLRSNGKSYNMFKLSRRWEKYGTPNFSEVEWACFQPHVKL